MTCDICQCKIDPDKIRDKFRNPSVRDISGNRQWSSYLGQLSAYGACAEFYSALATTLDNLNMALLGRKVLDLAGIAANVDLASERVLFQGGVINPANGNRVRLVESSGLESRSIHEDQESIWRLAMSFQLTSRLPKNFKQCGCKIERTRYVERLQETLIDGTLLYYKSWSGAADNLILIGDYILTTLTPQYRATTQMEPTI